MQGLQLGPCRTALLLLIALLYCALTQAGRAPVELSESVILVSYADMEPVVINGKRLRVCTEVARRSARWGAKRISMVVTPHWVGGRYGVKYYAFKDLRGKLQPASKASIARWQRGLQACFKAAADAGFTHFHILPHLDDPNGLWRNVLSFDPYKKYKGFSYYDVALRPATNALNAVVRKYMTVQFNVQGEMGKTLIAYPRSYIRIMDQLKSAVTARGRVPWTHVKTGISINWARHCACAGTYDPDPKVFNTTYAKYFQARKNKLWRDYDVEGFKQLLWKSDFIGLSGYGMLPAKNVRPADFEVAIHTAAYELGFWGLNGRQLLQSKPVVFSEWGLGGSGKDEKGIASNSWEAGRFPVNGKWMPYNRYSDPWLRRDLRKYRNQVYTALIAWLKQGGGPVYTINGLYQWSVGTFDILQVHPISTTCSGSFGDKDIQTKVKKLNFAMNRG